MGWLADRKARNQAEDEEAERRQLEAQATLGTLFVLTEDIKEQVGKLKEVTERLEGATK